MRTTVRSFPKGLPAKEAVRSWRRSGRRIAGGASKSAPASEAVSDVHDVPESCLQAMVNRHWTGSGGYSPARAPGLRYRVRAVLELGARGDEWEPVLQSRLLHATRRSCRQNASPLDVASYLASYTAQGPVVNDTRRQFLDLVLATQTTIDEVHMTLHGETRRDAYEPAVAVTYRSMPMKPPFLDVPRYRNGFFFRAVSSVLPAAGVEDQRDDQRDGVGSQGNYDI
ncbi:hypothetical protein MRX96_047219 [Rhipicephalus microplus]